jgi:RNA polymerase subunit RPABC4/transcription elongation factor Spt4
MEQVTSLLVGAASVIGALLAALLGGLTIWAFRDVRSRTRDPFVQILATITVGVIPVVGILVYLMLRPRETLAEAYVRALEEESLLSSIENQEFCPTCGRRVDGDMQWCPKCHAHLREACDSCGRAIHLAWDICPYCGAAHTPAATATVKPAKPRLFGKPKPAAPSLPTAGNGSASITERVDALRRQAAPAPEAVPAEPEPDADADAPAALRS